ncbi:MAG: hypothetical protein AB8G95_30420 [Anaerolineae bacterium]
MPNYLPKNIFAIFPLILISGSIIACSNSDTLPEVANNLSDSELVEQSEIQADSSLEKGTDDSGGSTLSPELKPISAMITGSDPAVAEVVFTGEFEAASPAEMPLYTSSATELDQAKALEIAQKFSMGNQLYFDQTSGSVSFYAFNAGNQLQIFPGQVQITNETAALNQVQAIFSADEVVAHAEAILAGWEWPDFEFELIPVNSNSAEVRRVINGEAVSFSEMVIQINANGKLASASMFSPNFLPNEMVPVISAEEALEKLASPSFAENGIRYQAGTNQIPEFQTIQPISPNSWRNSYPAGSKVNLTGAIAEFTPVVAGSGGSVLFLDRFLLNGAEDMLQSLKQHDSGLVTVSGTISPDGNSLQVDLWSAANLNNTDTNAPLTGVIRVEDSQVFLDNSRLGNGYLLLNPPNDLPSGSEVVVYQNFYFSNESGRFIEWNLLELQNPAVVQPQSNATVSLSGTSTITIQKMVIAYGRPAAGSDPAIFYAPMWRIYGVSDSGLSVVFDVPATK